MVKHGVDRRQLLASAAAAVACIGCQKSVTIDGADLDVADALGASEPQGFGATYSPGLADDVRAEIRDGDGFSYRPEGRLWLVEYPADALPKARTVYGPTEVRGMEDGFVALSQKCPHLGCRVPSCTTSQFFECPCHASKYNQVGEYLSGPAPRGMDRHPVEVDDLGRVVINTGAIIEGPPIGTDTTGQEPAGEFCIGEPES